MASPIPKPAATRQRRNKVATRARLQGAPAAPRLLPNRADGTPWRQEALDVWALAWASPMAGEFLESDVPGLLIIADLTHQYWTTGDTKFAAEIRLQRKEYGLAPLARRSLQWEVAKVTEAAKRAEAPAQPKPHKDPRAVLRAVG